MPENTDVARGGWVGMEGILPTQRSKTCFNEAPKADKNLFQSHLQFVTQLLTMLVIAAKRW